jgi:hypothetical protein
VAPLPSEVGPPPEQHPRQATRGPSLSRGQWQWVIFLVVAAAGVCQVALLDGAGGEAAALGIAVIGLIGGLVAGLIAGLRKVARDGLWAAGAGVVVGCGLVRWLLSPAFEEDETFAFLVLVALCAIMSVPVAIGYAVGAFVGAATQPIEPYRRRGRPTTTGDGLLWAVFDFITGGGGGRG